MKISFGELEERDESWSLWEVYYNNEPFTGIGYENGKDNYTEYVYVNGSCTGRGYTIHKNGQMLNEFTAQNGYLVGEEFSWYESGELKEHINHDLPGFERHYLLNQTLVYEKLDEPKCEKRFYGDCGEIKTLDTSTEKHIYNKQSEVCITIKKNGDRTRNYTFFDKILIKSYWVIISEVDIRNDIFWWISDMFKNNNPGAGDILSGLINHPNIYVQYKAIEVAAKHNSSHCIPSLEKELGNNKIGNVEYSIDKQSASGYSRSIAQEAKEALSKIKNGPVPSQQPAPQKTTVSWWQFWKNKS